MRPTRQIRAVIGGMAATAMLATAAMAQEAIRIGITSPINAGAVAVHAAVQDVFDLYIEDVNAAGGIDGRPIELIWEDSSARPEIGISAAQKLLSVDEVDILVNNAHSSVTLAMMELARSFPDTFFIGGGTSSAIDDKVRDAPEDYANFWTVLWPSSGQATSIAETFEHLASEGHVEERTIAFIIEETDYGRSNMDAIVPVLEENGWTIVSEDAVPVETPDFFPILSKLRAEAPAAVVSILTSNASAIALVRQSDELGLDAVHMGIPYPYWPEFMEGAGPQAEGMLANAKLFDPEGNAEHAELIARLEPRIQADAGVNQEHFVASCWTSLVVALLQEVGSADAAALSAAMPEFSHDCVIGTWEYDTAIHRPKVGAEFIALPSSQVQDGRHVVVWPPSEAGAFRVE